jgi:hypothetical protein
VVGESGGEWRVRGRGENGSRLLREREQGPQPLVLSAQALHLTRRLLEPVLQVGFGHGPDRDESTATTGQTANPGRTDAKGCSPGCERSE